MAGCRCNLCWGLAEYMHELTGKDYGLPPTPPAEHCTAPEPRPRELAPSPRRASPARQPWEPRPPRSRAA